MELDMLFAGVYKIANLGVPIMFPATDWLYPQVQKNKTADVSFWDSAKTISTVRINTYQGIVRVETIKIGRSKWFYRGAWVFANVIQSPAAVVPNPSEYWEYNVWRKMKQLDGAV